MSSLPPPPQPPAIIYSAPSQTDTDEKAIPSPAPPVNAPDSSPDAESEDEDVSSTTEGNLGSHIVLFSGNGKRFGDVLPPMTSGTPAIIPTAGDAEDHDHLDRRWKGFLDGTGSFWDDTLAHKYRTWSIGAWDWENRRLVMEVNGQRKECDIDMADQGDQSSIFPLQDNEDDQPINREDVMSCISDNK